MACIRSRSPTFGAGTPEAAIVEEGSGLLSAKQALLFVFARFSLWSVPKSILDACELYVAPRGLLDLRS